MKIRVLGPVIPLLGLSLLIAAGCNSTMEPPRRPVVDAVLNKPFWLSAGQAAVLAGEHLSVIFLGVLGDTRCPVDVLCMSAGNATMSVQAEQEGKAPMILSLTLTNGPQGVVYEGFGIHAQQLMPNRVSYRTIRPEDYSVRLLVDRP